MQSEVETKHRLETENPSATTDKICESGSKTVRHIPVIGDTLADATSGTCKYVLHQDPAG